MKNAAHIKDEQIIPGRDVITYLRLRREGYVCAWSGEGRICMVKPNKSVKKGSR